MSKKFLAAIVFIFVFFIFPTNIFARSGCCSHHGGVCGCGCCDGTSLSTTCSPYYPSCSQPVYTAPIRTTAPVVTYKPVYTPAPTVKPTVHPTNIPASTPTASPDVKGVATEVSPPPTPASLTKGETFGVLAFIAIIVGLPTWGVVKLVKKFRKTKIKI